MLRGRSRSLGADCVCVWGPPGTLGKDMADEEQHTGGPRSLGGAMLACWQRPSSFERTSLQLQIDANLRISRRFREDAHARGDRKHLLQAHHAIRPHNPQTFVATFSSCVGCSMTQMRALSRALLALLALALCTQAAANAACAASAGHASVILPNDPAHSSAA